MKEEFPEELKQFISDTQITVNIMYDEEGIAFIETNQKFIPVVNDILKTVCNYYQNKMLDSLFKDLPDKHKEYTSHIYRKLQAQKRWSFFWYTCFMIAVLIILLGGKF